MNVGFANWLDVKIYRFWQSNTEAFLGQEGVKH